MNLFGDKEAPYGPVDVLRKELVGDRKSSDPYADIAPLADDADPYANIASVVDDAPVRDWSNVKTAAQVQKVLDGIEGNEAKTAALKDWAASRVKDEVKGGLVPHVVPAEYIPGAGFMKDISALGNAAVAKLTGGEHGNTFEQERALQDARQEYAHENAGALEKGGAIAGGMIVGSRLPVAKFLQAPSGIARTINMAGTGAGYGALTGASEGDTLGDRAWNAVKDGSIGGIIGGAIEPLANAAGGISRAVVDRFRRLPDELAGIGRGASDRLGRAITDDGLEQTFAQQSADLGPEGMLADMGPNLRDQAGAIANRPGAGQTTLRNALDTRAEGATQRITRDVDAAFGPEQNLVQLRRQTVDQANAAATPHYEAFAESEIPMTQELAAALREAQQWGAVQEGVRMSRGQSLMPRAITRLEPDPMSPMTGLPREVTDLVPSGRELDYVKRALDARAEAAFEKGDTHLGTLINNTARRLTTEIDNILSPGNPAGSPYAQARGTAATGKQFEEGLRDGSGVFSRPKTHNPDQVEYDLHDATPAYESGYRAGARGDLANMANDAATQFGPAGDRALRKGMWSHNAERKIDQLADTPQAAQDVLRRRDAESTFAGTRNEVTQNSATARRQAAQKEFPAPIEREATRMDTTMTGLLTAIARKGWNAATLGHHNATLRAMADNAARVLSATGVQRDVYFNSLRQHMINRGASAAAAEAVTDAVRGLLKGSVSADAQYVNDAISH